MMLSLVRRPKVENAGVTHQNQGFSGLILEQKWKSDFSENGGGPQHQRGNLD